MDLTTQDDSYKSSRFKNHQSLTEFDAVALFIFFSLPQINQNPTHDSPSRRPIVNDLRSYSTTTSIPSHTENLDRTLKRYSPLILI